MYVDVLLSFECIYEENLLTSMNIISYTTSRIIFSFKYEFLFVFSSVYFVCKTRLISGGVSLIKKSKFFLFFFSPDRQNYIFFLFHLCTDEKFLFILFEFHRISWHPFQSTKKQRKIFQ